MPSFAPELLTYRDAIDHLLGYTGTAPETAQNQLIWRAVHSAYRDLVYSRKWSYYYYKYRLLLVAPYSTGTVSYDDTGGSHERMLTLTGGTWPSWSLYGNVRIGSVVYMVEDRKSDSIITLDAINKPVGDIAAGTTYTIYRDVYILPHDFREMGEPIAESAWFWSKYITPDQFLQLTRSSTGSGDMQAWTIMGAPDVYAAKAIHLYPYPDQAKTLDFYMQRAARPLRFTGYRAGEYQGTVSVTANSALVSGTGTAFTANMVGASIRVPASGTAVPDGYGGPNPWLEQKIIKTYTSASSVVVDSNYENTLTGVGYVVSDPVDVDPGMIEAFLRNCEKHLTIMKNMKGKSEALALYEEAFRIAAAADNPTFTHRVMGEDRRFRYDAVRDGLRGADQ